MKKNLLLTFLLLGLLYSPAIFAQDEAATEEEASFTLSGSVDTYFHTKIGSETDAPATSFANLKGFSLGMANLIASYEGTNAGFVADLVFGPRGSDAVFNSPYYSTSAQIVNQLYAYWKPSDNLTLTLGNFNTFLGYEVISPAVNFHYSTSYMFSYGPFSHTGIKGNLEFGDGMNLLLAVMNPTDLTEFNPFNTYTLGAQLGKTSDAGGIWLNLLYGDQDGTLEKFNLDRDGDGFEDDFSNGATFQVDLTTGWNLSETFYLGLNATYNSTKVKEVLDAGGDVVDAEDVDAGTFMGFAIYPKLTLSESTGIGLRAEYFAVTNSYLEAFALDENGDGNVIDLTLSLNHSIGNLTIIPEVRVDITSEDTFFEKDFDGVTNQLITLNLAAVYKF